LYTECDQGIAPTTIIRPYSQLIRGGLSLRRM
jgi:hypothetical protein